MSSLKTVLICGIGGPTPRSIAKTLRRTRPNLRLIGVDVNPKALGFFMESLVDERYLVPKASEKGYWEAIRNLIASRKVDAAFVMPEMEVAAWGRYFEEEGTNPCPVLLPPLKHTICLADKARMAELLGDTEFIPKTCIVLNGKYSKSEVEDRIGFPCWIRASTGSGGLGSLKLDRIEDLDMWLFIQRSIPEFTLSEFLPGRHLANQMMFVDGKCVKNAGLHCAEYVMADIAPSKVTGNTSFGILLNEKRVLDFCEEVMGFIQQKTKVEAHGVYSFDLKEDQYGNLKVTEINIRHMAYTGIMAQAGFDLVTDTLHFFEGDVNRIVHGQFHFSKEFVFLRDVDVEPVLMDRASMVVASPANSVSEIRDSSLLDSTKNARPLKGSEHNTDQINWFKTILVEVLGSSNRRPDNEISPSDLLVDDLTLDSLELAELSVRIEAEYGVDVFAKGVVSTVGEILEQLP